MTPVTLQDLSMHELAAEYEAIDRDWEADDDPTGRMERLDLLAAGGDRAFRSLDVVLK
jgi:hypothetical protein